MTDRFGALLALNCPIKSCSISCYCSVAQRKTSSYTSAGFLDQAS